ncbi:uncharacterized protein RSE6_03402 [Rhynchosporium secalis]|uniref:Uncharacterized protein n=1 Tax=Rhynchosporium secalis TaxID=38038 RepID=A0A1E1M2P2_RHYSE|nr:uncharacterized protein RSE6_03402 [Rhynchosporium secalis]
MFATLTDGIFDMVYAVSWVIWTVIAWILLWLPYIILCIFLPAALIIWFLSIDTIVSKLHQLFWIDGVDTTRQVWRGLVAFFIHVIWQRCVHAGYCMCFDSESPPARNVSAIATAGQAVEAELTTARVELETARADLATEKRNNTSLNTTSNKWRQRALVAEKRVNYCRNHHRDTEEYQRSNADPRTRVEELNRENTALKQKLNKETKNKSRHPLFAAYPNLELEQQILALQDELKIARENFVSSLEISTGEKARTVRQEKWIGRLMGEINTLKGEVRNIKIANTSSDGDEKLGLKRRIRELENDLSIAAVELENARRGDGRRETAAGNKDCARCVHLQDKIRQLEAEREQASNTGAGGVEDLDAVVAKLKEADQELDRLGEFRGSRHNLFDIRPRSPPIAHSGNSPNPEAAPPTQNPGEDSSLEDKATEKLKLIYSRFEIAMMSISQLEPGQTIGLQDLLLAIDAIPELIKTIELWQPRDARDAAAQEPTSFNDEATKDLKSIFDTFKTTMISINRFQPPGRDVVVGDVIELINKITSFYSMETKISAKLIACRSQNSILEYTIQRYNTAAREARDRLEPGTVSDSDYTAADFIIQAVAAVELLSTKIEQQMLFNRSTPNDQHAQLDSLQAEIAGMKVQMLIEGLTKQKTAEKTDRLRLVIETDMIQTRTTEHKRRHALFNNLEAVFNGAKEFLEYFAVEFPLFVIPNHIVDIYKPVYRDGNALPTVKELQSLAEKMRLVVMYIRGCKLPGSWSGWEESDRDIDGEKYRKEDAAGNRLIPLMEMIRLALEEVVLHSREVQTTDQQGQQKPTGRGPRPEGCTCVPQQPGTFTVPGSPCPVCSSSSPLSPDFGIPPDGAFDGSFRDFTANSKLDETTGQSPFYNNDEERTSTQLPPRGDFLNPPISPRPLWEVKPTTQNFPPFNNGFDPATNTDLPAEAACYLRSQGRDVPPAWAHFSATPDPPPLKPFSPRSFHNEDWNSANKLDNSPRIGASTASTFPPFMTGAAAPGDGPFDPTGDDALVTDGPYYWRSGNDPASNILWAKILGLQHGLRAHDIDITKSKFSTTTRYFDTGDIDAVIVVPWRKQTLLQAQIEAMRSHVGDLENMIWHEHIDVLGTWNDSPYNPESQSKVEAGYR